MTEFTKDLIKSALVGVVIAVVVIFGVVQYQYIVKITSLEIQLKSYNSVNDYTIKGIDEKLKELDKLITTFPEKLKLNREQLEKKMINGSITVYSIRQKGMGSGTVIKKTFDSMYILTCYHVIDAYYEEKDVLPTEKITIKYNNVTYAVDIIKTDAAHDLALLKVYFNDPNLEEIKLAKTNPKQGDVVYTVGNPMGAPRNISKGILSNYQEVNDDGITLKFYVVDALCVFGNSGGGLYNENAEFIGVPARVPSYGLGAVVTNMGLCISLDTVKEFIKGVI